MTKIKNNLQLMSEQIWNNEYTPPLLLGVQACTVTLEINMMELEIDLPQDPTIPLLGIYPKYAQSYHEDTCPNMFITALFIIVITWKQQLYVLQLKDV